MRPGLLHSLPIPFLLAACARPTSDVHLGARESAAPTPIMDTKHRPDPRPLLDRQIPAHLETATFALG